MGVFGRVFLCLCVFVVVCVCVCSFVCVCVCVFVAIWKSFGFNSALRGGFVLGSGAGLAVFLSLTPLVVTPD